MFDNEKHTEHCITDQLSERHNRGRQGKSFEEVVIKLSGALEELSAY